MRAPLASLALLALAGCGDVLFVEAELPEVCVTEPGVPVPPVPVSGSVELPLSLSLQALLPLLRTSGVEATVALTEVRVTPTLGNPDLSGITAAHVSIAPASGPPVEVLSYQRSASAPPPRELVLGGSSLDLVPYLVNGVAQLRVGLSGQPPATAWQADLRTCARGTSRYAYAQ